MNGHESKYLYYKKSGRSFITIPRAILDALNLNWEKDDTIKIIYKEVQGQKGLFLFKDTKEEKKES